MSIGDKVDNKINKYGVYRILKVLPDGSKEELKMEGKFFKPLKQTGGESVQTYQNEMPNFISNTRVEFEKQTGGA